MRKQGEEMTAVALMKAEEGFWKDVGMKAETGLVGGWGEFVADAECSGDDFNFPLTDLDVEITHAQQL
jgi:hypothetical protein